MGDITTPDIDAGRMTRRITIQQLVTQAVSGGGTEDVWQNFATISAEVEPRSTMSTQLYPDAEILFSVRYNATIVNAFRMDEKMRILHLGPGDTVLKTYHINSITDVDSLHRKVVIAGRSTVLPKTYDSQMER